MFIAIVEIQFEIPLARSLKDRRQGLEPFKARIARIAHYAVAEKEGEHLWNWSEIWVAVLAQSAHLLTERVAKLRLIAESNPAVELISFNVYKDFDLKS